MLSADALFKALAALVCAAIAVIALASGRRSGRALGAFLLLIALNQTAEAVRATLADPARALVAFRLASVFASLDPFVLAWFATTLLPARRRDDALLVATGATAAAFALFAGWRLDEPTRIPFAAALDAYTLGTYLYLLFRAGAGHGGDAWRGALVAALAVAAIPKVGPFVGDLVELGRFATGGAWDMTTWGIVIGPTVLGVALLAWLVEARARLAGGVSLRLIRAALAVVALLVVMTEAYHVREEWAEAGLALPVDLVPLGRAQASVRWLAFGAFASVAVLRDDAFRVPLPYRRRAARALLGLALLVGILGAYGVVTSALARPASAFEMTLLAGLALLSQGFRRTVDRVAFRLYDVPMPGDSVSAQEAYRRAAAQVVARGGSPSRDHALQQAREELGLDLATANILERLAEENADGPLVAGQLVAGRYHVERLLGRGGAGRVFLADDLRLERRVVLKEMYLDPRQKDALREARLAGSLQHARVATVHDVIPRGDSVLLVQEYVAGGTLADALASGPLVPARAERLMRGVLEGAAVVHRAGIAHGDLKPENVLLTPEGEPKLADFGIARHHAGATAGAGHVLVGTPEYLAPERLRGELPSLRADVYSLGVIARRVVGTSPAWQAVVARATAAEAEERWESAGAMLAALGHDQ